MALRMRAPVPLILIISAFVLIALSMAAVTPYRKPGVLMYQRTADGAPRPEKDIGAPDERQHANYIAALIKGEGIPVLKPGDPNLYETYQAHQPPTYYFIAVAFSKIVGADPENEETGRRIRWLSVLIGIATIAGVYCAALWASERQDVALAAAAFTGLMPMFCALNSAISNDPLLFAVCSWSVALYIRAARHGWTMNSAVGIGLLTGLALVTKTSALALLPSLVVALFCTGRLGSMAARPGAAIWAIALVIPLIVAVPWFWRNTMLYGDPVAMSAFKAAFVGSPMASVFIEAFGPWGYWVDFVGWWVSRSYIGVFGYMDIFLFETLGPDKSAAIYRFILALMALCAAGWVASLIRRKDDTPVPVPAFAHLICGAVLAVVVLLFIQFNMTYFQGQARYLYPATAPISLGLALGLCTLLRQGSRYAWVIVSCGLVALNLAARDVMIAGFAIRTTL